MRLLSARQAWHDAFYTPEVSRTESAREQAKLGVMVQHSSRSSTTNAAAHHALAGVVQSAIAMLPIPLQIFGHYMYAPVGSFKDYKSEVWSMIAVKSNVFSTDQELWFLASAAVQSYKDHAQGKPIELSMVRNPQRIKQYLQEKHSVVIDSRNWGRKYSLVWNCMFSVMDELDRRALEPVAKAIHLANEEPERHGFDGKIVVNFKRAMKDE